MKYSYPVGTVLTGKHAGEIYQIVAVDNGLAGIAYQFTKPEKFADGARWSSPAAAGKLITGWSIDVFRFWAVGEEPPKTRTQAIADGEIKPKKKLRTKPLEKMVTVIFKANRQDNLEPGYVRYFCRDCMAGFITNEGIPEKCPEGHLAKAPDRIQYA